MPIIDATVTLSRRDLLRRSTLAGAGALAAGLLPMSRQAFAEAETPAKDLTPDEALARLVEGNKRFVAGQILAPGRSLERVKEVAPKQTPFAAFLSCADSRVPVEIVFDQGFGDLFVVRVAGNVAEATEIASLEFGTAVLGAKVLMVLGHSACGAVKAAMAGGAVPGQISVLYQHIAPGIERDRGNLDAAIADNVRFQAKQLAVSPVIADLVKQGKLKLVGGVYDLESGRVSLIDL